MDAKQLPPEQREGIARALAPTLDALVQVRNYKGPFTAQLTVTLTDANGRTWSAAVTASDLTSVLSSPVDATRDRSPREETLDPVPRR